MAEETAKLMGFAKSLNLEVSDPVSVARYNPPWTPWFLRCNEVVVPIGAAT